MNRFMGIQVREKTVEEFKEKLTEWLVWYNHIRPHQSLNYQLPYQSFVTGGLSQK